MIWLIFLLFLIFNGDCQAQGRKIFIQSHLLYSKEQPLVAGTRFGAWNGWTKTSWEGGGATSTPENFLSPWRRNTASRLGLPITGTYASKDEKVVKYQYGLMKSAGIDGVFESPYDGSWRPIFASHLNWANEMGMSIGYEAYAGVGPDRAIYPAGKNQVPMQSSGCKTHYVFQKGNLSVFLKNYKNSSGYLRIDGKPAVWIMNGVMVDGTRDPAKWREVFPGSDCQPTVVYYWGNVPELEALIDEIEREIGEKMYVVMTGPIFDRQGRKFSEIDSVKKIVTGENISLFWNLFVDNHEQKQISVQLTPADGSRYIGEYQNQIARDKRLIGDKLALHVYTAFDERGLTPAHGDRLSGTELARSIISRDGNGMFAKNDGFLKTALDLAKNNNTWVFLESWNDWLEQHQIEPGLAFNNISEHMDYFSALRRVAEFKGISNPNFAFPPLDILDKPLIDSCRYKQFSGGKVKIIGTYRGNGNFTVDYLDDDLSYQNPSYLPASRWKNWKRESLKNFEINITPLLDKPAVAVGVDGVGGSTLEDVAIERLELDWYGQRVNLLDASIQKKLGWHDQKGMIGNEGKISLSAGGLIVNNSQSKFVHAGLNWNSLKDSLPKCVLPTPTPLSPPTTNISATVGANGKVNFAIRADSASFNWSSLRAQLQVARGGCQEQRWSSVEIGVTIPNALTPQSTSHSYTTPISLAAGDYSYRARLTNGLTWGPFTECQDLVVSSQTPATPSSPTTNVSATVEGDRTVNFAIRANSNSFDWSSLRVQLQVARGECYGQGWPNLEIGLTIPNALTPSRTSYSYRTVSPLAEGNYSYRARLTNGLTWGPFTECQDLVVSSQTPAPTAPMSSSCSGCFGLLLTCERNCPNGSCIKETNTNNCGYLAYRCCSESYTTAEKRPSSDSAKTSDTDAKNHETVDCSCSSAEGKEYLKKGDLNCDGKINITDFAMWKSGFVNSRNNGDGVVLSGDANCDGKVNVSDYGLWKNMWSK